MKPAFIDSISISSSEVLLVEGLRLMPIRGSSSQGISTHVAMAGGSIPGEISLDQNYPNPFNAHTLITFRLSGFSGGTSARRSGLR